jgi:hypothetical protein
VPASGSDRGTPSPFGGVVTGLGEAGADFADIDRHKRTKRSYHRVHYIGNDVLSVVEFKAVNQTQYASERTSARRTLRRQLEQKDLRRRGSDAFVANLFLTGGLLFNASFLPVHAP